MTENILFISHKEKLCGIHHFGYQVGKTIANSQKYRFIYLECDSQDELGELVNKYNPQSIIYNYNSLTLPWIDSTVTSKYNFPQIGMIHEVAQEVADQSNDLLFDYHIAPDPTLILKNPIVYKTGRLLLKSNYPSIQNEIPVIGSFGFATPNKRFNLLVQKVCEQFKQAVIRLNIPFSKFGDPEGNEARKIILICEEIVKKYPNIKLEYSHDFLNDDELLKFLASNTINVFLYARDTWERGISSVADFALSVRTPLAVSDNSTMFRHITDTQPSIVLSDKNKLPDIIKNGLKPLEIFYTEWTEENLIWDYERIITSVLTNFKGRKEKVINAESANVKYKKQLSFLQKVKRFLKGDPPDSPGQNLNFNIWSYVIKDFKDNMVFHEKKIDFKMAEIPPEKLKFNRILNDESRELYAITIEQLHKILPKWLERKIERANIQQAFVLDTVVRLTKNIISPKIISIGCFEDTAWGVLKRLGYNPEGIDPVLNYDIDTFMTKPSTITNSYDIVFSTSVIEHVEDDLTFLKNMCLLTKKNGYIILTCDFKEGYQEGEPKPLVDYRFYTKEHIIDNLLSNIDDCVLFDNPEWESPNPDFEYYELDKKFNYTFATIVLKKIK
jgi:hypothetical protein